MNAAEKELEARLGALPDVYPDFVWLAMRSISETGLVDEVLQMLDETPDATAHTVTEFECEYCGQLELYDEDGARVPVGPERMRMTRGMRAMLAGLRGKTLKAYVCSPAGRFRSAEVCRLELGSYAVDLEAHPVPVEAGGAAAWLSPMRCEKMSVDDLFRAWSWEPSRAYLVGERVTGVALVTERAALPPGCGEGEISADVAVVLRTARAAYTFARESWCSAAFRIAAGDGVCMPYTEEECAGELGRLLGGKVEGVARTVEKLA